MLRAGGHQLRQVRGQPGRDWAAAHQQAELQVGADPVTRQVGAGHQGGVVVGDGGLGGERGVARGQRWSLLGRPHPEARLALQRRERHRGVHRLVLQHQPHVDAAAGGRLELSADLGHVVG